jgi:hypothetical protein
MLAPIQICEYLKTAEIGDIFFKVNPSYLDKLFVPVFMKKLSEITF